MINTDQHRYDYIGYHYQADQDNNNPNNPIIKDFINTPNLNNLAANGLIFNKAYSSVPSCTPARSAILTGLSP